MTTPENIQLAIPEQLHRGLKNRHLQLLAIGGAIGTGLFMGSGRLVSVAGPSIIFVYAIIGFFVFLIMRALGELLLSNLGYKTFGDIAKDMLGPWAGFFVSWNYWFSWVIACVADITAIAAYCQFFWPQLPVWIPALAAAALLLLLNLQPVKWFGEMEFWFAIIKIVAILALLGAGVVLLITGFTHNGVQASISHLWDIGGMFPHGLSGFILGFQMGVFSFIGVELVGTAAAETEDPRKNLPKAINSIVARIMLFYIGSLVVIMSVIPWSELQAGKSPFVQMFLLAGFVPAALVMNLVVLTSAASSANSGVFSGSRMVFGLAKDGHAPRKLSFTDHRGVPTRAVLFTAVLLFSAVPLLFAGDNVATAFDFVSTMCATLVLFTWGSIVVSYIVYRRRYPERHKASRFKMPAGRVTPWLILGFFVFLLVSFLYSEATRWATIATPIWFALLAIFWQSRKRKLIREGRPLTSSIPTIT
ncbi:amino acid permease [Microbacterium panaciterrae]|uniref:D-serine/D-alanine/glycine transporter n=1 Tax=Microbacterium panaciterrae TaxID=985759 RepID=A0ABP8PSW8_9MICO